MKEQPILKRLLKDSLFLSQMIANRIEWERRIAIEDRRKAKAKANAILSVRD